MFDYQCTWLNWGHCKEKTFILNKYMNLYRAFTMQFDSRFFSIPQSVHQTYTCTCTNPHFWMLDVIYVSVMQFLKAVRVVMMVLIFSRDLMNWYLALQIMYLLPQCSNWLLLIDIKTITRANITMYLLVTEYQLFFKIKKRAFCK